MYFDAIFKYDGMVWSDNTVTVSQGSSKEYNSAAISISGILGYGNGALLLDSNTLRTDGTGFYFYEVAGSAYLTNNDVKYTVRPSLSGSEYYGIYAYSSFDLLSISGGNIEGFPYGLYLHGNDAYVASTASLVGVYFKNNLYSMVSDLDKGLCIYLGSEPNTDLLSLRMFDPCGPSV